MRLVRVVVLGLIVRGEWTSCSFIWVLFLLGRFVGSWLAWMFFLGFLWFVFGVCSMYRCTYVYRRYTYIYVRMCISCGFLGLIFDVGFFFECFFFRWVL